MRLQTTSPSTGSRLRTPVLWPDAVAFREAVQNPEAVLGDPDLRHAEVVGDHLGLPLAYAGRFAVVFRIRTARGDWALRCFTQAARKAERAERYRAISAYLEQWGEHFVPFRYVERGIRVGQDWYPVVAMRWAEGETLGRFVDKHHEDPVALGNLRASLTKLLCDLEAADITHGDWQHDNILVSHRGLNVTLVDYDGMFVPELAGQVSPEVGHPNYQHPARTADDCQVGLDRFSHLVIQTALLALSQDGSLWKRFNDDESILFRRADFQNPARSTVFHAVRAVSGTETFLGECLDTLETACLCGPDVLLSDDQTLVARVRAASLRTTAEVSTKWWLPEAAAAAHPPPKTLQMLPARDYVARVAEGQTDQDELVNLGTTRLCIGLSTAFLGLGWLHSGMIGLAEAAVLFNALIFAGQYLMWPQKAIERELAGELSQLEWQQARCRFEIAVRRLALDSLAQQGRTDDRAVQQKRLQQEVEQHEKNWKEAAAAWNGLLQEHAGCPKASLALYLRKVLGIA